MIDRGLVGSVQSINHALPANDKSMYRVNTRIKFHCLECRAADLIALGFLFKHASVIFLFRHVVAAYICCIPPIGCLRSRR